MTPTFLNNNIKSILAIIIVSVVLAYFFTVTFFNVQADKDTTKEVTIAMVAVLSSATGYYFGSSAGSAKKDDTIDSMAKNNPQPINQPNPENSKAA